MDLTNPSNASSKKEKMDLKNGIQTISFIEKGFHL